MKRIDLHIHTVATVSDAHFEFSIDTFQRYVSELKLDAVAVTNHDMFDLVQYREIESALDAVVFPGIEINVDKSHVLIIADSSDADDFAVRAAKVSERIPKTCESISVDELKEIFGDLTRYLVIPHSDKHPAIAGKTLEELRAFIHAGEVDSAKKFVRAIKDTQKLTPVLFSDARMKTGLTKFPTRSTFVDCGSATLVALKSCLSDKSKVQLSETDGNRLWQPYDDGPKLSTGLNVLIGSRSSGKTHTLREIASSVESVKFIRQFSLVQHDGSEDDRSFVDDVESRRSALADDHLSGWKRVVDQVVNIDLIANDRTLDSYVDTLLRSAREFDRSDAFSKAALFDEVEFPVGDTNRLSTLIEAVIHLIENIEFRSVIQKHVELAALKGLVCELIELAREDKSDGTKKLEVNSLVSSIRSSLQVRSAAVPIEQVDLYALAMDKRRVGKFCELARALQKRTIFFTDDIQGFRVEATRGPFEGAGEIKTTSGTKYAFSGAYSKYDEPYEYLRRLLAIDGITRSDLYRLFSKISYRVLNRDGYEVSGGERSEFRLLQQISDAQNYDVLLVDEPESSFDNLFLKSDVNQLIKDIAKSMPVVVVTHNSTVGASIKPDYLLFASKEHQTGSVVYRTYSGYPSDKLLVANDGSTTTTHSILLNSLEAGVETYTERARGYETIKS